MSINITIKYSELYQKCNESVALWRQLNTLYEKLETAYEAAYKDGALKELMYYEVSGAGFAGAVKQELAEGMRTYIKVATANQASNKQIAGINDTANIYNNPALTSHRTELYHLMYRLHGIWKLTLDTEQKLTTKFEQLANGEGSSYSTQIQEMKSALSGGMAGECTAYIEQDKADEDAKKAGSGTEGLDPGLSDLVEGITHPDYESNWGSGWEAPDYSSDWGSSDFGSDWGSSDFSSDWGGSGFGSSDFGGSGLGDLASDWGSGWDDSWTSELLDDTIDTQELFDATQAMKDISHATSEAMSAVGSAALVGMTDAINAADTSILATYGPKLAELAQRYGVQAGLVLGGAVALYATKEKTTEAVALAAEFFTTKCGPAVADVMDQVGDVAKQTRVSLSEAKSNTVAAVRGEKVGDLVG